MTKQELRNLKTVTRNLTKWESSGKAFGHYKIISAKATNKKGADKIYEFFCLMKVLEDLKKEYTILFEPGYQNNKKFPESPSPKKD